MRVLLRELGTGLYFMGGEEGWTSEPEKAHSFKHSAEAMQLALEKGFRKMEVVLAFDTPEYHQVTLPLP